MANRPFASPGGPQTALLPTEQHRRTRRSRPAVLDAGRTAAIPLRPLTMIEILDAAFLVLRRRPGVMIGLPVLIVLALVTQSLGLSLGVWLLGEIRSQVAQIVIGLLGVMLLSAVVVAAVMWVNAILTRVSLEVLMGPGFAPAPRRLHLRTMLRMTPAIIGLSLLQLVGMWLIQTGVGFLSYLTVIVVVLPDPVLRWIAMILLLALMLFLTCWAYSYLAMAVPAYMVENARTPAWIGKPWRATTVIGAYGRAFSLVGGLRRALRAVLVLAGTVVICLSVFVAASYGVLMLVFSLLFTLQGGLTSLFTNPWLILAAALLAQIGAGTVSIAYLAAVQSVLYLDLRMRREGLDLALRFDQVAVPQPVPPPAAPMPPYPMPPHPMPPQPGPPHPGPPHPGRHRSGLGHTPSGGA